MQKPTTKRRNESANNFHGRTRVFATSSSLLSNCYRYVNVAHRPLPPGAVAVIIATDENRKRRDPKQERPLAAPLDGEHQTIWPASLPPVRLCVHPTLIYHAVVTFASARVAAIGATQWCCNTSRLRSGPRWCRYRCRCPDSDFIHLHPSKDFISSTLAWRYHQAVFTERRKRLLMKEDYCCYVGQWGKPSKVEQCSTPTPPPPMRYLIV